MVSLYYRDAAASIICYDVRDASSFKSVHYWLNEMKVNNNIDDFVLALAGNKADADTEERQISKKDAEELGATHKMVFRETSAKTGMGVKELFGEIAQRIVDVKREQCKQRV